MDTERDKSDDSPIKPVSSLRSHFETFTATAVPIPSTSPKPTVRTFTKRRGDLILIKDEPRGPSHISLDISKETSGYERISSESTRPARLRAKTPPRSRTLPVQPSAERMAPQVTNDSSRALPYTSITTSSNLLLPTDYGIAKFENQKTLAPAPPPARRPARPSRSNSPIEPTRDVPHMIEATELQDNGPQLNARIETTPSASSANRAPPINRARKPVVSARSTTPLSSSQQHTTTYTAHKSATYTNISTTLPDPEILLNAGLVVESVLPSATKPMRLPGFHQPITFAPQSASISAQDQKYNSLPMQTNHTRSSSITTQQTQDNDGRPSLPPRAVIPQSIPHKSAVPPPTSSELPRRSALALGFSQASPSKQATYPPLRSPNGMGTLPTRKEAMPPRRASSDSSRRPRTYSTANPPRKTGAPLPLDPSKNAQLHIDSVDTSSSSRRPPHLADCLQQIANGYETRTFDVCGEHLCTTGATTRIWHLISGKLLYSVNHGEYVRGTAISFKPARKIDEEGMRVWLGTNMGEIQEIDILSKRVVEINPTAHTRREVLRIYRHTAEMWTLDSEGRLYVWPPDDMGTPNLSNYFLNPRLSQGHVTSLAVDGQLWFATAKELRVFRPGLMEENENFMATAMPLNQLTGAGDISSSAKLYTDPDRVYFGHSDGKVTYYSRKTLAHLGTVIVSAYRISCLVGVGRYLWAGNYTGVLHIYDTTSETWTLKKEWKAHDSPVAALIVDRSSIWKMGRLQVLSLSVDNTIKLWDGLLQDDWLDDEMSRFEAEYCDFRIVRTCVLSWNAGASKPSDFRHTAKPDDSNFFRNFMATSEAPDIFVFGLQELVDLEDKRLTAKSLFKSRHKDTYGQEQLGSVYRVWRDYLGQCLEEALPSESYTLLHTASMVGLFTCIFIKASQRPKVRELQGTEVKCGMGGLHGNKGGLIARFCLDDSSICFVNCHLAAGQTHTSHRNNDVSAILESSPLPGATVPSLQESSFVGGGDGTMVMDHEFCIVNGDLNYRLDNMSRDTVLQAISTHNYTKLLERDQLILSRRKNPGFRLGAFAEAPIDFAPTYKYDAGTDNYDTGEKRRVPAYCDRILHRGGQQVDYRRHEMRVSDHRPVSGTFQMRIKTVHQGRRLECVRKSEERFEEFHRSASHDAKLDYLTIFGLSQDEARRLLES